MSTKLGKLGNIMLSFLTKLGNLKNINFLLTKPIITQTLTFLI